ncbi:hypothetical protein RJ55_06850 [Drechmeria coniospora]|nr:hypothetical protein RJ55_06850 [Drechmeria coniospora]
MPGENSNRELTRRHRSTLSPQKTDIVIHVYDLLPPGRLSSILWTFGASLLHSGVVIGGREYAYGGHDKRNATGVYWTKPKTEPPGGTFRCEILHGFTLAADEEIDASIRQASDEFLGTSYNLLTRNCNHFTSYLCKKLTGKQGPGWLNRAASIGVALPCVVPRGWIEPPECEQADGELADEDGEHEDENSHMLEQSRLHFLSNGVRVLAHSSVNDAEWSGEEQSRLHGDGSRKGKQVLRDGTGRQRPPAERVQRR